MTFSPIWNAETATLRKNRRMFHRLATGTQIRAYLNEPMRFLTLTSSKEPRYYRGKDGKEKERDIRQSWQALRARIKRAKIEKDGFNGFNLNKYYALRTEEGNGVYHIVFWGGNFIPYKWLSKTWEKIHGAWNVSIEFVHEKKASVKGLTGYLLDRYLLNQPIKRMSYGWGWAWLGFCKSWQHVKQVYCNMRKGSYTQKNGKIIYDQEKGYVPFTKMFSNQPTTAWLRILATRRKTSRQIKILKFT